MSGWISRRLQKKNFDEARKMREEEKLERDRALGMSALLKMGHIHMVFECMKSHFQKGINRAEAEGHTNFFQYVLPFANMPAREQFTYEELGLVFSLKNDDLFNEVWDMNPRQIGLLDAIITFNVKCAELHATLQSFPFDVVEGTEIKVMIPDESLPHFEIQKNVVNSLIKSIYLLAEEGAEDAEKIFVVLQEALNSTFELGVELDLISSNASEEAPQQTGG